MRALAPTERGLVPDNVAAANKQIGGLPISENAAATSSSGRELKTRETDNYQLEEAYKSYAPKIAASLRRAFGDGPPDPEDMTNLAFQKLLEKRDLSAVQNLKNYLWRTARNLTLKEKRKFGVRTKYDFEIEHLYFATKWDERTPEGVLKTKQQLQAIDEVLRSMPKRRRRSFLLHKVEGLPLVEVGRKLGIPKSTAHREVMKAAVEIDVSLQLLNSGGAT